MKRKALALTVALLSVGSCGKSETQDNPLKDVSAIVVLQRQARMSNVGDVFQYTSYVPGAKLMKVSPPATDGVQTELCCGNYPGFENVDIQSYDISFDAKSIVFSAKLSGGDTYGLYILPLTDLGVSAGAPVPIGTNLMHDYVYPIFSAADRVTFVSNEVVEAGAKQHRDEYERGNAAQLGSISTSGTDEVLGPRNLSHRVSPFMMHSGEVGFTQWDHEGDENSGHLMKVNPDFTNLREVYGKEGTGVTNSYLKAVEVETNRVVVIGTSRDRTFQSGKLLDVSLGKEVDGVMRVGEEFAHAKDLTPQVPGDRDPSSDTVGRYYDAYPIKSANGTFGDDLFLLVSWSDGPVEEETNGMAGVSPDFGVYLFDSSRGTRLPILNNPGVWDLLPRPLIAREAPTQIAPAASNMYSAQELLLGSLNVYNSTKANFPTGSVVKMRVIEGFSVEEGIPEDFGLTEDEGAALIGEIPVEADGSWAALVQPNIPLRIQAVDKYDLSLLNEPVWISGRPGEARMCGGCHERRGFSTVIQPGQVLALANTPPTFNKVRAQRKVTDGDYSSDRVIGVPWDIALQNIFDAKCIGCHDGDKTKPGNKTISFQEEGSEAPPVEFTFNLTGGGANIVVGDMSLSTYSWSHLSLLGVGTLRLEEKHITVTGDMPAYVMPKRARDSILIQKINPPAVFPTYDEGDRFIPGQTPHPQDVGGQALTRDEYRLLVLMADFGGQFYSRENAPGGN